MPIVYWITNVIKKNNKYYPHYYVQTLISVIIIAYYFLHLCISLWQQLHKIITEFLSQSSLHLYASCFVVIRCLCRSLDSPYIWCIERALRGWKQFWHFPLASLSNALRRLAYIVHLRRALIKWTGNLNFSAIILNILKVWHFKVFFWVK